MKIGILLDLKKAFDTVDQLLILLQKLNHHGIRRIINDWFASYLLDRSQVTEVGFNLSTKCMISCGVPQGFVLGPLLLLMYINDIHNSSAKFSFFLFADDTNLLYADTNLKSLEKTVSSELLKVSDWLSANKLTLNAKKSNYVIFRPYQRKLNYSVNIEMIDNCTQIPTTLHCKDHVKYLGFLGPVAQSLVSANHWLRGIKMYRFPWYLALVSANHASSDPSLLDSNLSWKFHIDNVALKVSRTVGVVARLRHFVPRTTLLNIYQSLILPYLRYGLAAWGQAAKPI